MSNKDSDHGENKAEKLNLRNFVREKELVSTSNGDLWIRHLSVGDLDKIESDEPTDEDLGKNVVMMLASKVQDKVSKDKLSLDDFELLSTEDLSKVIKVVAENSGVKDFPVEGDLQDLGKAIRAIVKKHSENFGHALKAMHESIAKQYGFLQKSSLDKLQEQMADVSRLRSFSSPAESLANALVGGRLPHSANRGISSTALQAEAPKFPELQSFTHWEDTGPGLAARESADLLRDTTERMRELVDVVGGINQTIVGVVLPAWFAEAEQAQAHSNRSLMIAIVTLIVSVVVAAIVGVTQIYLTITIDRSGSETQKKVQETMSAQLDAQNRQIALQTQQIEMMQKFAESEKREPFKNKVRRSTKTNANK